MPDIIDLEDPNETNFAEHDSKDRKPRLDRESLKERLANSLGEVDVDDIGCFATSGLLPDAANPGLQMHGVGSIELPLSEHDACQIKKKCHQAPFGKGTETIVDTNVRSTWELNPNAFDLSNPAWKVHLEQTLENVKTSLGFGEETRDIHAELYKLLLYEQGAFFEKHTE